MTSLVPTPKRHRAGDVEPSKSEPDREPSVNRVESILRILAEGMRPEADANSMQTLVRHLGKTLPATWVFLLEATAPGATTVLRTVASWGPEGFHDGFEVEPEGSIFERFLEADLTVAMWVSNRTLVPQPLSPRLVRGLGMGLFDAQKTFLGSLVVLSDQPIAVDAPLEAALQIYAAHAAAELDRAHTVTALESEIQQRRIAEEDLNTSYRDLRDLAHHLQSIQEDERSRIAGQIHDELGQVLTALKIDLAWIRRNLTDLDGKVEERFKSIGQLIDSTVRTVRRIATELRPRVLDELGLISALEWQINDHRNRSELECRFHCDPQGLDVEPDVATAVFRSFQELMTNILRHAEARKVEVSLVKKATVLELTVRDDGKGLQSLDFRSDNSFGLLEVQERAKYWGGTMSIETSLGNGTEVTLHFPLESP